MHVFNTVWLLLIVYSTLAIKQHVLLDALAGAALGAAFGWASLRSFAARGNGPE
jgi:membrane-associated phospholipid phosphatase